MCFRNTCFLTSPSLTPWVIRFKLLKHIGIMFVGCVKKGNASVRHPSPLLSQKNGKPLCALSCQGSLDAGDCGHCFVPGSCLCRLPHEDMSVNPGAFYLDSHRGWFIHWEDGPALLWTALGEYVLDSKVLGYKHLQLAYDLSTTDACTFARRNTQTHTQTSKAHISPSPHTPTKSRHCSYGGRVLVRFLQWPYSTKIIHLPSSS